MLSIMASPYGTLMLCIAEFAALVAIGPQRHHQVVLILRVDDGNRHGGIVGVAGVAAAALIDDLLEQLLPVFRWPDFCVA